MDMTVTVLASQLRAGGARLALGTQEGLLEPRLALNSSERSTYSLFVTLQDPESRAPLPPVGFFKVGTQEWRVRQSPFPSDFKTQNLGHHSHQSGSSKLTRRSGGSAESLPITLLNLTSVDCTMPMTCRCKLFMRFNSLLCTSETNGLRFSLLQPPSNQAHMPVARLQSATLKPNWGPADAIGRAFDLWVASARPPPFLARQTSVATQPARTSRRRGR